MAWILELRPLSSQLFFGSFLDPFGLGDIPSRKSWAFGGMGSFRYKTLSKGYRPLSSRPRALCLSRISESLTRFNQRQSLDVRSKINTNCSLIACPIQNHRITENQYLNRISWPNTPHFFSKKLVQCHIVLWLWRESSPRFLPAVAYLAIWPTYDQLFPPPFA